MAVVVEVGGAVGVAGVGARVVVQELVVMVTAVVFVVVGVLARCAGVLGGRAGGAAVIGGGGRGAIVGVVETVVGVTGGVGRMCVLNSGASSAAAGETQPSMHCPDRAGRAGHCTKCGDPAAGSPH